MLVVNKVRFSKLKMVNKNSLINSELKKSSITLPAVLTFTLGMVGNTINVIKTRRGDGYPLQF